MSLPNQSELNLMSYLKIFFKSKEMVLIPAFFGLVIGICTGIILPKEYTSSTILLVEEGKSDNPLFDKLAVSTNVGQRMLTIKESMLGWNSLVELVKRLGLSKDIRNQLDFEKLILGIRKRIDIKQRGSNIIQLTYAGKEPQDTRDVVKTITEIFIERNVQVQSQETADAIRFIEEQLKLYKGKIKSSEIAQLRDQLKVLMVDATEKHPKVRQLKEQIKIKEDELRAEHLEYNEDANLGDGSTNALVSQIQKALDKLEGAPKAIGLAPDGVGNKDFYKVMLIDKLDSAIARDVDVNTQIYNMLLQRLETARITQRLQTSKEGTRYTILDPPRIPLSPTKPNRVLIGFLGLFLGVGAGVGMVIMRELLDKSFIDVEEAKQFLGTPLLGAISKINTEINIRMQREKELWVYSLSFVIGVVMIVLTKAIVNFLQ